MADSLVQRLRGGKQIYPCLINRSRKGAPRRDFTVLYDDFGPDVVAGIVITDQVTFEVEVVIGTFGFAISPVTAFLHPGSVVAPDGDSTLLRRFLLQNFGGWTPGDINRIGGHADFDLSLIDELFLLLRKLVVSRYFFQTPGFNGGRFATNKN